MKREDMLVMTGSGLVGGRISLAMRTFVWLAAFSVAAVAAEKRVDNPVDAWMTAVSGPAGKAVTGKTFKKNSTEFRYRPFKADYEILDATDAKQGQFSVTFSVDKPETQGAFGFYPGQYFGHWALDRDFSLHLWLKAESPTAPEGWSLVLYDTSGKRATTDLDTRPSHSSSESSPRTRPSHSSLGWLEFDLALAKLKADDGFSFGGINAVQVEAGLPEGARLWLDDVYFKSGGKVLGISDKTVTQHMAEAAASRARRVHEALASGQWLPCRRFIPDLYNGHTPKKQDLADTYAGMLKTVTKETSGFHGWNLWTGSAMCWRLYGFGSKGKIKPGMLSPEVEKATLEFWWDHCLLKNDIATARRSTWNVSGSENHDINFKTDNLLSSQLFMSHPDFAKRIYPDLGRMAGYAYGDNAEMNKHGDITKTKLGSGNYKDGKEYTAEDHYVAWLRFWKEYFAERAKRGFFIEHNANGYMYHTNRMLHDIYAWCEDAELRRQTRMFMDLIWAQWAQDQTLLLQGGSATRGGPGATRMGGMAEFFLGGPAVQGYFYIFSDYQWPRQVWEMMLDRPGMGEYAYISRKPNEARDDWPREPGTEYTMLIRPDSRLKRYSWVTPDYVMGLRMDHPDALYCHLYGAGEGITFPTTPNSTIRFGGLNSLSVQDRNVAMMIFKRQPHMRSPSWFFNYGPFAEERWFRSKVTFGTEVDRIVEKDGWVFAEEGNAFVACRIIAPLSEAPEKDPKGKKQRAKTTVYDEDGFGIYTPDPKPYIWTKGKRGEKVMEAIEVCTPLIVEAGRRRDYPTLEAFQKDILDNPIILKQIIAGRFLLTYRGCDKDAKTLYLNGGSQETPMVDGKYIDYECPAFDSPYLKGAFGSGIVTLTGPISGEKLVLDFNKIERR